MFELRDDEDIKKGTIKPQESIKELYHQPDNKTIWRHGNIRNGVISLRVAVSIVPVSKHLLNTLFVISGSSASERCDEWSYSHFQTNGKEMVAV